MLDRLFSLDGRVALVTGASRGIGRAIASAFAEAGASVVVSSRNRRPPELEKAAEEIRGKGGMALAVACHVGKKAEVENAVRRTVEAYGRIDILVNNAGGNPVLGPMIDLEEAGFDKVMEVNVKGALLMSQAAAREMIQQGGGRIINIGSASGLRARADGTGAYCVSKSALHMLTQVMARELAPQNILVNAIAPGSIKTEFSRVNWENPERRADRLRGVELRRFGEPEEVVGAALFLASEAGSFVTGEIIRVDGGEII